MKTKAAYLVKAGQFEILEEEVNPGKGEVLIKMAVCALCNYELNHWEGLMGTPPMKLGHEGAGTIVEVGEGVEAFKVGDKVTGGIWQSFSEYAVANQNELYRLKDNIDPTYGFCEPLKCVTTVLRSTSPEAGDCGVVVGCGPMGLWCIQGLKGNLISGLIAIDVKDSNLELAKKYGATHVINPIKEDAEARIAEITGGHMADFVIEGTGNPVVLDRSMNYLRASTGRLVVMSSFKHPAQSFDLRLAVKKAVRIIVAHGSDTAHDDWRRATDMINNGTYIIKEVVSHEFKLEDINTAFQMLENKPEGFIKGIIKFSSDAIEI